MVDPWHLSTEEALARLRERYVTHYDDCGPGGAGATGLRSPLG